MSITRLHRKKHNFTIIDNSPLQDSRLSWKARGLLAYLLTKPDGWQVRMSELISQSDKDGRDSVRSGFKELEQIGYAIRWRSQNPVSKQFEWNTEVFETTEDASHWIKTHGGKPVDGTHGGFSVDGKPVDILITDEVSNKGSSGEEKTKQKNTDVKPPKAASKSRNANSAKGADRACACDDSFLKDDKATTDVEESKQQEEQSTPGLNQTDNAEKRISNNSGKRGKVPLHSTTKKKSTKPEFDKDGYWNIPLSGKSDLAGRLTIQTMQLLILAETEDVEWYQEQGMVWIREPKDGWGFREAEMLIKVAPLGRMKTFNEYGNEGCCCYSFCKDWFNGEAPVWLDYWRSQIEDHGKSAVSRQTKSLALYLYDLRDEKGKRTLDIKWQSADEVDWVDFEDVA